MTSFFITFLIKLPYSAQDKHRWAARLGRDVNWTFPLCRDWRPCLYRGLFMCRAENEENCDGYKFLQKKKN